MSTAPARPGTEAATVVLAIRWDVVVAWLLILAGVIFAGVAWSAQVIDGRALLALQAVIVGAALLPRRPRA